MLARRLGGGAMKKSPSLKSVRNAHAFAPRLRRSVIMVNQALLGLAALAALPLLVGTPSALALPTGGEVVAGSAHISQPNAQTMQINQASQKAILNWQGFSIATSEAVNFLQPSASAVALNRVVGSQRSDIFGSLTANGQLFLVNPNGVLFAPSASVDVGGIAATTLNIRNEDFLAGNYVFFRDGNAGSVVNQGTIHAPSGYAALIGPKVTNEGFISARLGSVALAAGDRVALDMIGDGLISVRIDQAALGAAVLNKGTIQADGGKVLLAARSADSLLDTVINNTGIIRATSLIERNGVIVLDGGSTGVVSNSGTLDVAGVDAGTTGGTVKVLGKYVGLFDRSRIDASGDTGGGTVLVGGNWQGQGPERNASRTIVGPDATISASAVTRGDGGTVVVWSNDVTKFHGSIDARGGAQGGDGGKVETSGAVLQADGRVDVSAPHGTGGLWLLDPYDISIENTANSSGIDTAGSDFTSKADSAVLDTTTLGAALTGGVTVRVITGNGGLQNGDITVHDTTTAAGSATLELHAQRNITFAPASSITNGVAPNLLNVSLFAGTDGPAGTAGTNPSSITMAAGSSITTGDGNVTATAKSNGITLAGINTGTGSLAVNSNGGTISQNSALTVGGTASFNAGNNTITLADAVNRFAGAVSLNTTGAANNALLTNSIGTVLGTSTVGGNLTVTAATGGITQTDALSVGGNLSATTSTVNQSIDLSTQTNSVAGSTSLNTSGTGDASIKENAINFSTTNLGGKLTATAATGGVTQSGALAVGGASNITAVGNAITLTDVANHFTGMVTLTGTVTKVTDRSALTVQLNTGETNIIANAGGGAGGLTVAGNAAELIAISNGGVFTWNSLTAGSAILIAAMPSKTITGPGSKGNVLDGTVQYSNLGDATGTKLVVPGELVLIARNVPRTGSGDSPSITADSAILNIASLQPGNRVTIILNGSLRLLADTGEFRFAAGSKLPAGVSTLDPDVVKVFIGNVSITATRDEVAQRGAFSAAQQSALSSASADARQSFGTDSVTQQIDMGFSGDVGIAPTMGHSVPLEGEIISTPRCVPEAKAGVKCRK